MAGAVRVRPSLCLFFTVRTYFSLVEYTGPSLCFCWRLVEYILDTGFNKLIGVAERTGFSFFFFLIVISCLSRYVLSAGEGGRVSAEGPF